MDQIIYRYLSSLRINHKDEILLKTLDIDLYMIWLYVCQQGQYVVKVKILNLS